MIPINSTFVVKTQNYLHHGPPKPQNTINKCNQWQSSSFKNNFIKFNEENQQTKEKFKSLLSNYTVNEK